MGENEKLGFSIYFQGKPMCNDVGCATQVLNGSQMPSIEDYVIAGPSDAKFMIPPTKFCGNGFFVVDELTKLPKDMFRTNISTDDADFKRLSEGTAQRINKAFEDIRKTMEKDFPMAFTKRKARKQYKPKFTL